MKVTIKANKAGQVAVDCMCSLSSENNMILNSDKTKIINVSILKAINITDDININNKEIDTLNRAELLIITIDIHLSIMVHVEQVVAKARKRLYLLAKMQRSGLSIPGLIRLYMATIRLIIAYVSPAWFTMINKQQINLLERIQNSEE